MSPRTKNMAWTIALVLFLGFAIYSRFQWLSLVIPGALLVWYGLMRTVPGPRIGIRKTNRSGLN